jgi:putative membrane protein
VGSPSDHLANERTFLAWVRTGIALIGFGFVIAKFAVFISLIERSASEPSNSLKLGEAMIFLGALVTAYGLYDFIETERALQQNRFASKSTRHAAFVGILLVVTIAMALLVL